MKITFILFLMLLWPATFLGWSNLIFFNAASYKVTIRTEVGLVGITYDAEVLPGKFYTFDAAVAGIPRMIKSVKLIAPLTIAPTVPPLITPDSWMSEWYVSYVDSVKNPKKLLWGMYLTSYVGQTPQQVPLVQH